MTSAANPVPVRPTTVRHCSTCGGEQLFEQPPCEDGHAECPEWACVACGFAVVVGGLDAPAPVRVDAAA
ncbi:MAG TPA: hypothetical protein VKP64_00075 [Mycobacteriales bacterium]|nr:hypothetical protein [Mycobacteriales bacterium]